MSAIHGRGGRLYVDVSASANTAAVPLANLNKWEISGKIDRSETTSFGATTRTYQAGLPDAQGSFAGFYDDAANDLFVIADGVARRFYLYPDRANKPTQYWYGYATFETSASGDVSGAVAVSGTWAAASSVTRIFA